MSCTHVVAETQRLEETGGLSICDNSAQRSENLMIAMAKLPMAMLSTRRLSRVQVKDKVRL
tara:strand:- start:905 stop:1087 length:183 start_codon:yes stop_codon:yes gene_type:complete